MTQLKPFRETMTKIGNAFGFHDIHLDELEKFYNIELIPSNQWSDDTIREHANSMLFLQNHSDETTIMLKFATLYVLILQFVENNKDFGFLVESSEKPRVYTSLDKLVEYLAKYHKFVTNTEVFVTRFDAIQPIELI